MMMFTMILVILIFAIASPFLLVVYGQMVKLETTGNIFQFFHKIQNFQFFSKIAKPHRANINSGGRGG